jgi:protein-tyrosine phosphatase
MDHLDYTQLGLKHIVYPLLDHKSQNIAQFFEEFYGIVERQIRKGNILVHCSAGISRVNFALFSLRRLFFLI